MNEKAKRIPIQNHIMLFRIASVLGILVMLIALGFLVKLPDEKGVERSVFEQIYARLVPPAPIIFNGETWEVMVDVSSVVDETGERMYREYSHRIVLEMYSDGETVYGNYQSASINVCDNANFTGKIDGDSLTWIVTYSGSCCPNAQIEFSGTIDESHQRIDGEMRPVGLPPEGCWTWWADVSMYEE